MATAPLPKQKHHILVWHRPTTPAPISFGGARSYARARQAAQSVQATLCGAAKRLGDVSAEQAKTLPASAVCSACRAAAEFTKSATVFHV